MFSLLVTWIVSATRLPLALMPEACETWSLEYGAYAMPCQELEVFPPEKLTPTLVVPPVTSLPVFAKIRIPCEYVVKLKLGELMLIART